MKRTVLFTCMCALMLSACTSIQGVEDQPTEHRKLISASAYSLSGCQEKLDAMGGGHVEMNYHLEQIAMSALNLGIVPPYYCQGVISDGSSAQGKP